MPHREPGVPEITFKKDFNFWEYKHLRKFVILLKNSKQFSKRTMILIKDIFPRLIGNPAVMLLMLLRLTSCIGRAKKDSGALLNLFEELGTFNLLRKEA
jgi:hypothetical protein